MVKEFFIYSLFIIIVFCFISCEDPYEPVTSLDYSIPKVTGKSAISIDVSWDETSLAAFKSYDVFYKDRSMAEPKLFITIPQKNKIFTSITGLKPNTEYTIFIVTNDKNGDKHLSYEIFEKTYTDIPSPITVFTMDTIIRNEDGEAVVIKFSWSPYTDEDSYVPFDRYEFIYDINPTDRYFIATEFNVEKAQIDFNAAVLSISSITLEDLENSQMSPELREMFLASWPYFIQHYFRVRTYNTLGKYNEYKILNFPGSVFLPPK